MKALTTGKEGVDAGAVRLRREIHALPETAFEEIETAGLIAARMIARGLKVRTGVGKTGVAALFDSGRPGKTVLLRADLDALPLTERTGLPFAATNGKMHACGHDGHVAALDAAADLLLLDPPARGRVVFAFQPAEEGAGGAKAMIADGVLDDPRPDVVFGVHLWTALPLGHVGVARGAMMAAVDEFSIEVTSPGGHASAPQPARTSRAKPARRRAAWGKARSSKSKSGAWCGRRGAPGRAAPTNANAPGTRSRNSLKSSPPIVRTSAVTPPGAGTGVSA